MPQNFILVDFENVQPASLGALKPGDSHIKVFAGAHQNKVELGLAQALQPFGSHAEYIQIVGSGKDALDFHIAFYIGKLSAECPGASFTIISRDTGFDPLVKHLAKLGVPCKRISAISGSAQSKVAKASVQSAAAKETKKPAAKATKTAKSVIVTVLPGSDGRTHLATKNVSKVAPKPSPSVPKERIKEVVDRLVGLKAARPGTVKTLRSSLKSWFKPALAEADVDALFDLLVKQGMINVSGTKMTYALDSK